MSLGRRGARLVTLQACAAPPGCCPHPSLAPADPHRSSSSPPTSTHLSHRPGQPSPLGMCSGLRQGHRCPHSGRGRNADSSHHVGLMGRLRVGEGSSLQPVPRRAGPWGLQAARPMPRPRPDQTTPIPRPDHAQHQTGAQAPPRALSKTACPRPPSQPWGTQHLRVSPWLLSSQFPPSPRCQVPHGDMTGPSPPCPLLPMGVKSTRSPMPM